MSKQDPPCGLNDHAGSAPADSNFPTIEESRSSILDAFGNASDLTFVRPHGNLGDQLIWAGTRELLKPYIRREIEIDELPAASGEVALISGGGAWRRRRLDYMPDVLEVASRRFDRIVVLPSSFDVSEDRVRRALSGTDALVFARETESFRRIQGICSAALAHDCAFFADIAKYAALSAKGTLNAFRVDDESANLVEIPNDNEDISDTCSSLDAWLRRIAAAEEVNTDRAHVMIAAARMGRRVNYLPNSYFKVEAIARTLTDFDVRRHPAYVADTTDRRPISPSLKSSTPEAQVQVHLFTRDNAERAADAVAAVLSGSESVRLQVHDRNSGPHSRVLLADHAASDDRLTIFNSDRDIGTCESIRLAAEHSDAEYLMFLSAEMRPEQGAMARLVEELEANPDAAAAAPMIVGENGAVESCGGWPVVGDTTYDIVRAGRDLNADEFAADPQFASTQTGWVPLLGSLIRRSALADVPVSMDDHLITQNADWCLRIQSCPDFALRATSAAKVLADWPSEAPTGDSFQARSEAMYEVISHARFLERHGRVIADRLGLLVPELRDEHGEVDIRAARLLLKLAGAEGHAAMLIDWMNGGLAPLLGAGASPFPGAITAADAAEQRRQHLAWLEQRNEMLSGIEAGGWWRLRERIQPLRNAVTPRRTNGDRSAS